MTDSFYRAAPMSRAQIEKGTWAIRSLLGMVDPFLPVSDLIEYNSGKSRPATTTTSSTRTRWVTVTGRSSLIGAC